MTSQANSRLSPHGGNLTPSTCDISKFFSEQNGRCCNIGTCALSDLKYLDLDSKPDKGASVRKYVDEHPVLSKLPRHVTQGGVHLAFSCPDMPKWMKPNGRPYHDRLVANISPQIHAELFHCNRNNLILPPSVHPDFGFVYTWTILGEVPIIPWNELRELCPWIIPGQTQQPPGRPKKAPPWFHRYRGNIASLDLIGLLSELKISSELVDAEDHKYRITCPWEKDHSEIRENDTSTVVWQPGEPHWPAFKCLHRHGPDLSLEHVLTWAEEQTPGIVDRFCASHRVWSRGQRGSSGLPRILHPHGQLDSAVYEQIADIINPHHVWFIRGDEPTIITDVPSGFEYSSEGAQKYKVTAHVTGFRSLSGIGAKSDLERYMEPGHLNKDGEFIKASFNPGFTGGMLAAPQFKEKLPRIIRILTVPLPLRVGNKLVYPSVGYDPRFGTYLTPDAPALIHPLPSLQEAIEIIDGTMQGCRFTSEQSRIHARARLITPFARGIFGWTTRVPLWFYCANRPRAGKDYLSGCTMIIYEGVAHEDAPIGRDSAETGKRIVAAELAGRRLMHFSNCGGYLNDDKFYSAVTNVSIRDRLLGSNAASADLTLPNELEFSLSANIGFTARPDFEPRTRKIELEYYEENENERTFPDRYLHGTIASKPISDSLSNRRDLSALGTTGVYKRTHPVHLIPSLGETVGGVMEAAGLGDPCRPFLGTFDIGYDPEIGAAKSLWTEAEQVFQHPDAPEKSSLYDLISTSDTGALEWFGPLTDNI